MKKRFLNGTATGGWSFAHTDDRLFSLGSTEYASRVAYRTGIGDLRLFSTYDQLRPRKSALSGGVAKW